MAKKALVTKHIVTVNLEKLSIELEESFEAFRDGKISIIEAREMNKYATNQINIAGRQIAAHLVQSNSAPLDYIEINQGQITTGRY